MLEKQGNGMEIYDLEETKEKIIQFIEGFVDDTSLFTNLEYGNNNLAELIKKLEEDLELSGKGSDERIKGLDSKKKELDVILLKNVNEIKELNKTIRDKDGQIKDQEDKYKELKNRVKFKFL